MRESLQTTIEELETANEELRSTNEELQSTNEELQSTNEELETSKEELQSLNEESTTVNAELQARIDELTCATDDLKNLLDSTQIATVFLDTELRIRRFTPASTRILPLTAGDVGRPIQDLTTTLKDVDLADLGRRTLADLALREVAVEDAGGRHWALRVHPYRTRANVIDGVVVTCDDVTERRLAEQARGDLENRYRLLFELARDSLVLIDAETGTIADFNQRAHEALGYTRDEFERLALDRIDPLPAGTGPAEYLRQAVEQGEGTLRTRHRAKDGTTREVDVRGTFISIGEKVYLFSNWQNVKSAEADK